MEDDFERSDSFNSSGSAVLILSPEPGIRMLSPEPPELPREFSNMKYPLLNRTILSMSSDINDEDEESIEDEEDFVFCSSEKGDHIEDSIQIWDENVSRDEINRIKNEETSRMDDHSHEYGKHLNSKGLEKNHFKLLAIRFLNHILVYFICTIDKGVQDGNTTKRRFERKDTGACLIPSPRRERGVSNDTDFLEDGFLHLVSTK